MDSPIKAEVLADSYSHSNDSRITTLRLHYPRFIHAELLTHRVFSRNASSSRAIPIDKVIEQVSTNPARPRHFGRNQAGMQAQEELTPEDKAEALRLWEECAASCADTARKFQVLGLHKQVSNRILEPFQYMNTIVTATEWDNFFNLRLHPDAQPEIMELAQVIKDARDNSVPNSLVSGEWHIPGAQVFRHANHPTLYKFGNEVYRAEDALKISASICAQVSYRKEDTSLEKAINIYNRLISSEPKHASPFEHQATPITDKDWGVTHMDKDLNKWSGNFKGWVQYRQIL